MKCLRSFCTVGHNNGTKFNVGIMVSKFNVGFNDFEIQCRIKITFTPRPIGTRFYGDLVYKFKKIRGMTDFSDQFRKSIMRCKCIGYNLNIMRQFA